MQLRSILDIMRQLYGIFNICSTWNICLKMWIPVCVDIKGIVSTWCFSWIKIKFKMGFVLAVMFNQTPCVCCLTVIEEGNKLSNISTNYNISAIFLGSDDGRLHALSFDML